MARCNQIQCSTSIHNVRLVTDQFGVQTQGAGDSTDLYHPIDAIVLVGISSNRGASEPHDGEVIDVKIGRRKQPSDPISPGNLYGMRVNFENNLRSFETTRIDPQFAGKPAKVSMRRKYPEMGY